MVFVLKIQSHGTNVQTNMHVSFSFFLLFLGAELLANPTWYSLIDTDWCFSVDLSGLLIWSGFVISDMAIVVFSDRSDPVYCWNK